MLPHQWETYKKAARLEKLDKIPFALIIDSPWIPGYLGIQHLDYYRYAYDNKPEWQGL